MNMQNFSMAVDGDGVAIVSFDLPDRRMNTITAQVQRDLDILAERLRKDDTIRGAVIASGKPNGFCAGADLGELQQDMAGWREAKGQEALKAAVDSAGAYSRRLRALETCGKPIAAAVAGVALGGGLELALACSIRVAVDDPTLRLGLPEATIGLMPGAGGTQRLPRLMGVEATLPHLLEGRPIPLADALAAGVVHAVAKPGELIADCRQRVLDASNATAPWDAKGYKLPGGALHSPAGYQTFPFAIARLMGASGVNYPAQANILRAVYEGVQVPIDAGLRIESRYFFNTIRAPRAGAMVDTLFSGRPAAAMAKETGEGVEAYLEGLRLAWNAEAQSMVDEGVDTRLVIGVARRLGGWAPDLTMQQSTAPHLHLHPEAYIESLGTRLLNAANKAAKSSLKVGEISDALAADALAVAAGFPAWTGGPISYRRQERLPSVRSN